MLALSYSMTTTLPPLVGMIGRKRSGKDTFASVLVQERGFVRLAFADPLKSAALALNPLVGRPAIPGQLAPTHDLRLADVIDALGWEKAKDVVPEVRRTLQLLGTDSIRALDPDFWLRIAMRETDSARDLGGWPVVVTDCRFPNEADAIREAGGVLVRVRRRATEEADPHPTETALDDYEADEVVQNDGTIEDLQAAARALDLPRVLWDRY